MQAFPHHYSVAANASAIGDVELKADVRARLQVPRGTDPDRARQG
jgi:hypothetical protein